MDDFDTQIQCEELYADGDQIDPEGDQIDPEGDQIDPREDFSRQLWSLIAEFINDRHLTADEVIELMQDDIEFLTAHQ